MGLLNKLFSPSESDDDIALQLFESQGIGGTVGKKAQKILNSCQNRQEVLLKAIELCGSNPSEAKQFYIVSRCYVWLGAKYRVQAIEYLEKYIAAGASWSGTPKGTINYGGVSINQLEANKSETYHYLGKAYEGEYQFEKAEQAYLNAEKLSPYFATYSVCVANTYVKRNDLQKALNYLLNKKQTSYYKSNVNEYKVLLDAALDDINSKIKKGYVYKPRRKKSI